MYKLLWELLLTFLSLSLHSVIFSFLTLKHFFFYLQTAQSELDLDTVKTILGEYRIHNADIVLRYDATAEDLIDVVEGNRVYIPCIYILNKIDQISVEVTLFCPISTFF